MSALFAIILGQAIINAPPVPYRVVEFVDLSKITPPRVKFECNLISSGMKSGSLNFNIEGGRAYSTGNQFDEMGRVPLNKLSRTPRFISILSDEHKLFDNDKLGIVEMDGGESKLFNTQLRWRLISGGNILDFWNDIESDESLLVKVAKGDMFLQASGLCRRKTFLQLPLSKSEIEEVSK